LSKTSHASIFPQVLLFPRLENFVHDDPIPPRRLGDDIRYVSSCHWRAVCAPDARRPQDSSCFIYLHGLLWTLPTLPLGVSQWLLFSGYVSWGSDAIVFLSALTPPCFSASQNFLWRILMIYVYLAIGFFFYLTRIPERFAPGKFDLFVRLSTRAAFIPTSLTPDRVASFPPTMARVRRGWSPLARLHILQIRGVRPPQSLLICALLRSTMSLRRDCLSNPFQQEEVVADSESNQGCNHCGLADTIGDGKKAPRNGSYVSISAIENPACGR
jgi:hypothetical protein